LTGSDGAFTRTPESVTLIPGTLLRLNCGTSTTDPVLWSVTREGSGTDDMTSVGVLVQQFTQYFYIDSASPYDLVAQTSNADESYCGTYECIENQGAGDSSTATVASKCKRSLWRIKLYNTLLEQRQKLCENVINRKRLAILS